MDKKYVYRKLAESAKLAEKELTDRVNSRQARWPNSAFNLLIALAIYSIQIINQGQSCILETSSGEIQQMAQIIITSDEYIPGSQLPFTKEQMRQAFEEIQEGGSEQ